MIAVERQDQTPDTRQPLRQPGGYVVCPNCGSRGLDWHWRMREEPRHAAYTVPVYQCRNKECRLIFAIRPETGDGQV